MLTVPQLQTLKAAALADGTAAGYITAGDVYSLTLWFNALTASLAWNSNFTAKLARQAITVGASQLDNLTVGKRDSLLWFAQDTLDARDANVQAAITNLCGSQNILLNALLAGMKRQITRAELALAGAQVSGLFPLTFEGTLTTEDVNRIPGA